MYMSVFSVKAVNCVHNEEWQNGCHEKKEYVKDRFRVIV
jgi:hypothetical protein